MNKLIIAVLYLGTIQAETIFHLALPVSTLEGVQEFYEDLGGKRVAATGDAIAFDFYGHSLIFRRYEEFQLPDVPLEPAQYYEQQVMLPSRHFGVIITREIFEQIEQKMVEKNGSFFANPLRLRPGESDEVWFMMIQDPNGYAVEIKAHIPNVYLPVFKE